MYIMLLKVYWSSFSAVVTCTTFFNRHIIDLLRNKDESLEWTAPTFKCDQEKRETWKGQCESSKWKV